MKLSEFDFNLPKELIAQQPTTERSESNLVIPRFKNSLEFDIRKFSEITSILEEGDLLIFNDSKVINANLLLINSKTNRNININLNKPILDENNIDKEVIEQAEIHLKYSGYIAKEKNNADKLNRLENIKIPANFDYSKLKSLSYEAKEKLEKIRPATISQASRISGVSPSDISVMLVYMGR